jgi:enamine deaminase RidA (YjgF/YER057c/UK114 family)
VEFLALNKHAARARLASDMVLADDWADIAGVLPIDLDNDRVALADGIEGQTRQVLANLDRLLEVAGLRREDVFSVRVSLVDFPRLYERMNLAYVEYFPSDRLPARSCVGVTALTRGALVEMDFLVRRPPR